MKVVVLARHYLPGFRAGGPIVSISRILFDHPTHDSRVVTRDRDLGERRPYDVARSREWVRLPDDAAAPPALVAYLGRSLPECAWLVRQLRGWRPDLYYLNSVHDPWFSLLPLLYLRLRLLPSAPVLVAPRGEFSPGALALKRTKKSLARPVVRWLVGGAVRWHLSSERELADLRRWWARPLPPGHRWIVAVDPPQPPAAAPSVGGSGTGLRVTFVSRIHPKKGLREALVALGSVRQRVDFEVFGPVEDHSYWEECRKLQRSVAANIGFEYGGVLRPEEVTGEFAHADVFLFPTSGENFGHVVAEALSVGCPVVCGPDTLWTELIERSGGLVSADPAEIAAWLDTMALEGSAERAARRAKVLIAYRSWFESRPVGGDLFARAAGR